MKLKIEYTHSPCIFSRLLRRCQVPRPSGKADARRWVDVEAMEAEKIRINTAHFPLLYMRVLHVRNLVEGGRVKGDAAALVVEITRAVLGEEADHTGIPSLKVHIVR